MEGVFVLAFGVLFWYFAWVGFKVKVLKRCYCKRCIHNDPCLNPNHPTIDGGVIYGHRPD